MKKGRFLLLAFALLFVFFLVFSPHFVNRFPLHVDEWHHITQAMALKSGNYAGGMTGFEWGFHFLLACVSYFFDLVIIYFLFPAIWAVISASVLFYVSYRKTGNYWIGLLSVIFFAFIKSNVNITGLWFFTPLTFSIPFIFLYIYYFTEGIENQNREKILISLGIMLFLLPIHSISVLFAIPFLTLYSAFHFRYIKKEWKLFSSFVLIPLVGILIFWIFEQVSFFGLFSSLIQAIQFRRGWGMYEIVNSPFELYAFAGYLFALAGIIVCLRKDNRKKYLAYILWPLGVLAMIGIYRITGISYLSPYSRNLYYFVIGLPFLSAVGLFYVMDLFRDAIGKIGMGHLARKILIFLSLSLFFVLIFISMFGSYFSVPKDIGLYSIINQPDYDALLFLKTQPQGTVMAGPYISMAVSAVSMHEPYSALGFYNIEGRSKVNEFFNGDCDAKNVLVKELGIRYVIFDKQLNCGWESIYNESVKVYRV